ncbi:MAG: CBS domain-containing protein [Chloroflexi bacterium]|nr:CBS domain-containing protein [Chloroflexota bacterium]
MPKSIDIEARLLAEPIGQLELTDFCIVTADSTVREAVSRMRATRHNCAFIVGEKTQIKGILTDRDVLKKVVTNKDIWDRPVTEVMTPNPHTVAPEHTAHDAMAMMKDGGYRNIPVVDGTTIIGNVTHFAVLRFLTDHIPEIVYNLPPDPDNYADDRAGG